MSKNFKVSKEDIARNPLSTNDMDTDVLEGFVSAARNNQPTLALRYLVHVLRVLDEKLTELQPVKKEALTDSDVVEDEKPKTRQKPAAKKIEEKEELPAAE